MDFNASELRIKHHRRVTLRSFTDHIIETHECTNLHFVPQRPISHRLSSSLLLASFIRLQIPTPRELAFTSVNSFVSISLALTARITPAGIIWFFAVIQKLDVIKIVAIRNRECQGGWHAWREMDGR